MSRDTVRYLLGEPPKEETETRRFSMSALGQYRLLDDVLSSFLENTVDAIVNIDLVRLYRNTSLYIKNFLSKKEYSNIRADQMDELRRKYNGLISRAASLYTGIERELGLKEKRFRPGTEQELDEDKQFMQLEYDSIRDGARRKYEWHPIIQALYDFHDAHNNIVRVNEIPEHVSILGLFQIIWYGKIVKYYNENEYPTQQNVKDHIDNKTRYKIDVYDPKHSALKNKQSIVPDYVLISHDYHPRIFMYAPDFSMLGGDYYNKSLIKFHPSQIFNPDLFVSYRDYAIDYNKKNPHRPISLSPPLKKVYGEIISRVPDVSNPIEGRTGGDYIPSEVVVKFDEIEGEVFQYDISKLLLAKDQPKKIYFNPISGKEVEQRPIQRPTQRPKKYGSVRGSERDSARIPVGPYNEPKDNPREERLINLRDFLNRHSGQHGMVAEPDSPSSPSSPSSPHINITLDDFRKEKGKGKSPRNPRGGKRRVTRKCKK